MNRSADYDGSAKVALLGAPLIADLIWLSDELERVLPAARAFVRPGVDEPEDVAKLLAVEGGRL